MTAARYSSSTVQLNYLAYNDLNLKAGTWPM